MRIGSHPRALPADNREAQRPFDNVLKLSTRWKNDRPDKFVPAGYERNSAISDTLEILADPWRFLIIREAFFGCKRFSEFEANLKIPRATLSKCLSLLVERGLFEARSPSTASNWKVYMLSERGIDLYPVLLGLMWFGDKWSSQALPPVALFHKTCRSWLSPEIVWSHNLKAVDATTVVPSIGPEYWRLRSRAPRNHHKANRDRVRGLRPCNIERTLSVVGDRWTFMILQECFHGIRRFDEYGRNLAISSNVLSSRLSNLTLNGFLSRRSEDGQYLLTDKGRDIYGPMLILKNWGDRWLRPNAQPTWVLIDRETRRKTEACVVCPHCRERLGAREVSYTLTYA